MSLARKIFANTTSQIAGKILMALVSVVIIKIITNYLSRGAYGTYTVIYDYLTFFAIAADLGLFTIAIREMSKDERDIPKILGNILSIRLILAILLLGGAIVSSLFIQEYEISGMREGIMIASLVALLNLLHGTLSSVLQVKLQMQKAAFAMVAGKLIALGYIIFTAFFAFSKNPEQGFMHLIWAGVIGNCAMFMVTAIFVSRIVKIRFLFDRALQKTLFLEALPYGLALVLNMIYFRINSVMLFFFKGEEEVGIYAPAMRILEAISVFPLYFMNTMLTILTKKIEEKSPEYHSIIQYSFDALAMISVPIVAGGLIMAKPIIEIASSPDFLSTDGFFGSDIALQILLFATLFSFLNVLFSFILIAVKEQHYLLFTSSLAVLINVGLNFLSIPIFGFRGAAFTSVISELVVLIGLIILSKWFLDYSLSLIRLVKILFSALVMAVVIFFLLPWVIKIGGVYASLPLIVVGGGLYFVLLYLTKAITPELLRAVFRKTPTPELQQEL